MDIFAYLLLQIINGYNWNPKFGESSKFKNWIAILDIKTCLICRNMHGKIWDIDEAVENEPPVHPRCRCSIKPTVTVKSGTATVDKTNGSDRWLMYNNRLPDSYIKYEDALKSGWKPNLGNLASECPDKQITNGQYKNRNGHLPEKENRIWYEADINYKVGYRNNQRIVWSSDGLIFVTFDHYNDYRMQKYHIYALFLRQIFDLASNFQGKFVCIHCNEFGTKLQSNFVKPIKSAC